MNPTNESIGLLHPGAMGAKVGEALRSNGVEVFWVRAGRSGATRARAAAAGLTELGSVDELVARCGIIVSLCPPHAAIDVAESVVAARFCGIYVDANATSPERSRAIAKIAETGGARFVDGGVIGPPPARSGTTRFYLSGAEAPRVAALFAPEPLEAIVMTEGGPQGASEMKMAYGGWTKGSAALLLAIRALARAGGVEATLLREWELSLPGLDGRCERQAQINAPKAWRFAGEMNEIAETFEAAGLPPQFHEGAAEIYDRLADFKDAQAAPPIDPVIDKLLQTHPRE